MSDVIAGTEAAELHRASMVDWDMDDELRAGVKAQYEAEEVRLNDSRLLGRQLPAFAQETPPPWVNDVQEMFDRFNRDYFNGRKPRCRVLTHWLWPPDVHGFCQPPPERRIIIAPHRAGDRLAFTLLHEMCHIGCPGHGREFQRRVRRLLPVVPKAVAALLEEEVQTLAALPPYLR